MVGRGRAVNRPRRNRLAGVHAAPPGVTVDGMSEQTAGYDPAQDPDSDPASLNPRTGSQAAGGDEQDVDTDAEPANLNPRGTEDDA